MHTRPLAYLASVAVMAVSAAATSVLGDGTALLTALAVTSSLLIGWAAPPRVRPWALAMGAGCLAVLVPEQASLSPTVAGLVLLSISEDPRRLPWLGWAGGLAGGLAGSVLAASAAWSGSAAAFVATGIGGGAALLLRYYAHTRELAGETVVLRDQATWHEQRTSVARELHDVVGHHVTAMVVHAEAGRLADPLEALRTIGELGRTALADLDSLVVHLRDPASPLTVSAPPRLLDIDELLAEPLRRSGVCVDVALQEALILGEVDVLTVYRVTQEALTNVARHSGAKHAWVDLTTRDDVLRLRISDDGVGPPPVRARGSGLVGIDERVTARGGTVELIGRPGGGSILDVCLPVAADR